MVWGQGDGSGLRAVDSTVGRIGQLACWEHYNPLARYATMADGVPSPDGSGSRRCQR
jgi:nitrilase